MQSKIFICEVVGVDLMVGKYISIVLLPYMHIPHLDHFLEKRQSFDESQKVFFASKSFFLSENMVVISDMLA